MTDFTPAISLTDAMSDPSLFGKVFSPRSFWTWKVVAKLIDNIPLTEPREIELFAQCTGRSYNRQAHRAIRRLIVLAGRRAGKDRFLSACGVWRAALCANWRKYQSAGEGAVVILLGRDKKQAAILRRYCRGLLQAPELKKQVIRETRDVIEFKNGSSLEIASNDVALVRGRSAIAVLGSECCHWKTGDYIASSDEEVVGAAEPSMSMCPDGGLLILGSSVYRKRGYMFRQYRELFGNAESDDICWFAPSSVMNPKLPAWVIERAMAKDPHQASAEYNNIWRKDQSECYPFDAIEANTDVGVYERPYASWFSYVARIDMASGGGSDSAVLAIAHREKELAVLDLLRERKPRFDAYEVIAEYAQILKQYRISELHGDRYAFQLFADAFKRHGIRMPDPDLTTSEMYLRGLPLMLGRRFRLLADTTLRNQLLNLERRVVDGHESVDHPKATGAHDDVAAAAIGALVTVAMRTHMPLAYRYRAFAPGFRDEDLPPLTPPQPAPIREWLPDAPARPEPVQANGDWWKSTPHQQPSASADDRLRQLYGSIDQAAKGGFIR